MTPRSRRAIRAVSAATTATFVAAAFHVLGGGSVPGSVTLAVTTALATLLCLALQSATFSFWRLSASVAVSQLAFHVLFGITGGASTLAGHDHLATAIAVPRAVSDPGTSMGAAHVAAACLTILFLVFGERALTAIAGASRSSVMPPR